MHLHRKLISMFKGNSFNTTNGLKQNEQLTCLTKGMVPWATISVFLGGLNRPISFCRFGLNTCLFALNCSRRKPLMAFFGVQKILTYSKSVKMLFTTSISTNSVLQIQMVLLYGKLCCGLTKLTSRCLQ